MKNSLTSIDLFAGAGGLTEGFSQAGFNCLFANEHESPAHDTFRLNHPNTITSNANIESLDPKQLQIELGLKKGELSILLGGPPCQGFSTYGQRDPRDPRNRLPEEYLRFLAAFRPRAFLLENVLGLLSMQGGRLLEHIREVAHRLRYEIAVFVLDAADYGVPQYRKRVFVVGLQDGLIPTAPEPTHISHSKGLQFTLFTSPRTPHITVRDAISDLEHVDPLKPKETHHCISYPKSETLTQYQNEMRQGATALFNHSAKRMLGIRRLRLALLKPGDYGTALRRRLETDGLPDELVHELLNGGAATRPIEECRMKDREKEAELRAILRKGGINTEELLTTLDAGGFANKYRRLDWSSPSHTLVAHMARDCSDFVHPNQDRFISVREAARLQSFPDTYQFSGSQFRQFRAIGNAVPPRLGFALATKIASQIS